MSGPNIVTRGIFDASLNLISTKFTFNVSKIMHLKLQAAIFWNEFRRIFVKHRSGKTTLNAHCLGGLYWIV